MEQAILDLDVSERVTLAGFQTDVYPFLSKFHCLVVPSREEPWGLVAMEAMSAGVPVIAADHGGLPEVLDEAALYFPLGDIERLASQIRLLRDSPELGKNLRERGIARVHRFGLEPWLDRVEGFVQRVLGLPPHERLRSEGR